MVKLNLSSQTGGRTLLFGPAIDGPSSQIKKMQFHRALDTQLYQSRLVIYAKQKSNRKILRLCFSGPSGSGDRGVTPVYLRCTQGRVTWKHPRGALRVLLRMPNAVSSTARFRACVRPLKGSGGATVWVEERASLKKMFPEVRVKRGVAPKSECSLSENGQVALFVEMEAGAPDSDLIFYYHLEQLPSTGRYDPEKGRRQF
jgi:hypothetical protein